jgi:hypothetical protein
VVHIVIAQKSQLTYMKARMKIGKKYYYIDE